MSEDKLQRDVERERHLLHHLYRWADAATFVGRNGRLRYAKLLGELFLGPLTVFAKRPDGIGDGAMRSPQRAIISQSNMRHSYWSA